MLHKLEKSSVRSIKQDFIERYVEGGFAVYTEILKGHPLRPRI